MKQGKHLNNCTIPTSQKGAYLLVKTRTGLKENLRRF